MVTTSTALVPRRVGIDVLFTLMYESTHGITKTCRTWW